MKNLSILNEIDNGSQIKDWLRKRRERRLTTSGPVAKEILIQGEDPKANEQRLGRF